MDGMAVRRGLGGEIGPDHAVRSGPVVDDELLLEDLGIFRRHQAHDQIGRSARRKTDDDADRLCRVRLGAERWGRHDGGKNQKAGDAPQRAHHPGA
ncbi:hypothetical protein D3C83_38510 [compost metagenome]